MTSTIDSQAPSKVRRSVGAGGTAAAGAGGAGVGKKPATGLIGTVKALVAAVMARPGIAHLLRASKRFTSRLGSQFAAAITYFSFLALVPILMVGFSIAGFVLNSRPDLMKQLEASITKQIPGDLSTTISKALNSAVDARVAVGLVGLVVALYSGIGWMGNIRAAVQAQWRPDFDDNQEISQENFFKNILHNLWMLAGLGLSIVISLALSAAGGGLVTQVLGWLGLSGISWLRPVFVVIPILLAMAADLLIFMWLYTVLPPRQHRAPRKALIRGSIIAAVAFEILKIALTYLLPNVLKSPTGKIFGPIIGLLFFFNLVATVILFVAAWIATSPGTPGDPNLEEAEPAELEVLEPALVLHDRVSRPKMVGLLGAGVLLGWGAARRRR